jgi:hypothetical protein
LAKASKPLGARETTALKNKAKTTKLFNLSDLRAVYKRGKGAFLSAGSRPGQTMQSWAMARVNSLIRGSRKHDLDIRARANKRRRK